MPNDKFKPSPCPFCGQDTDYKIEYAAALVLNQIGFSDAPWLSVPDRFVVTCNRCESVWFEPPVGSAPENNGKPDAATLPLVHLDNYGAMGVRTEPKSGRACCTVGDCPICNRTGMADA